MYTSCILLSRLNHAIAWRHSPLCLALMPAPCRASDTSLSSKLGPSYQRAASSAATADRHIGEPGHDPLRRGLRGHPCRKASRCRSRWPNHPNEMGHRSRLAIAWQPPESGTSIPPSPGSSDRPFCIPRCGSRSRGRTCPTPFRLRHSLERDSAPSWRAPDPPSTTPWRVRIAHRLILRVHRRVPPLAHPPTSGCKLPHPLPARRACLGDSDNSEPPQPCNRTEARPRRTSSGSEPPPPSAEKAPSHHQPKGQKRNGTSPNGAPAVTV